MKSTRSPSQILIKIKFSRQTFEKYLNIKFHENPSRGSRVVQCGQMDGQTNKLIDMTKLIVSFLNFANPRANYREGNITIYLQMSDTPVKHTIPKTYRPTDISIFYINSASQPHW
jgi:hypothetical protein